MVEAAQALEEEHEVDIELNLQAQSEIMLRLTNDVARQVVIKALFRISSSSGKALSRQVGK